MPGKLTLAYTDKMNEYFEAIDEYMNVLVDAQSAKGNDPEAIRRATTFSNKAKFLIKKMQAAEMAWVGQGYKNEYDEINAYISAVTQRSMVLYKQDLLQKFNNGVLTSTNEGQAGDFYYTALLPGNWASSKGWTEFTWFAGDYETHFDKKLVLGAHEPDLAWDYSQSGVVHQDRRRRRLPTKRQQISKPNWNLLRFQFADLGLIPGFFLCAAGI